MNRVLKIRVWDSDTGYFLSDYKNHVDFIQSQLKLTDFGSNAKFGFINNRLIIQQYTGLKDKNGKEIYEGDITQFTKIGDESVQFVMSVEWGINSPCGVHPYLSFHFKGVNNFIINPFERRYKIEIIGNIYENPELLNL